MAYIRGCQGVTFSVKRPKITRIQWSDSRIRISCIRLIFCAHPIGSDSPITTNLQKTGRKGGGHYIRHSVREIRNYIIPIPPAPPAGAAGCGSLIVDTTDSVVSSVDATLVAFWRALLVTFAGSRIPFSTISTYSSL